MKIDYSHSFKKEYKKLSLKLHNQLRERLLLFLENQFNPLLNNHAVHYPYEGCRSINITGDLRALYETDNDRFIFVHIGTHIELYK